MKLKLLITIAYVINIAQAVSIKKTVTECFIDSDCVVLNPYFVCKEVPKYTKQGLGKVCTHKPLWPLHLKEWIGTYVFASFMLIANVGGIGGGGVAIPLAMYFFNLSMKPAVAISSFSILCSTFARFFFNWSERHPDKPFCTSIDYGLTNVMMPLNLMGSLIGAYLYVWLPDLILMIILTSLLLLLTIESCRKFFEMRKKENEAEAEAEAKQKEDAEKEK